MTAPTHDESSSWQPILNQLRKPGGLTLGFAGVALSLITIFVLPQWDVPVQWLTAVVILWLMHMWIAHAALRSTSLEVKVARAAEQQAILDQSRSVGPKIIQAMSNPAYESEVILLLQPHRLFGQSMVVSIYYEDERGFELLVAEGRVSNVQSNGLIQITVTTWETSHDDIRRSIVGPASDKLDRLLVRPASTVFTPTGLDEKKFLSFLTALQLQEREDGSR